MKKREAIEKLVAVRKKLVELIKSIPVNKWDEVFLGKWSLEDVVAHLIGWDIENAKSVQEILKGKRPGCFDYWDENWVTYNDTLVKRYKKGGKKELLSTMRRSHIAYVRQLENISDELFDKDIGLRWKNYVLTPAVNAEYETQDEEIHTQQVSTWLIS